MIRILKTLVVLALLAGLLVSGSVTSATTHRAEVLSQVKPLSHTVCNFVPDTTRPNLQRGSTGNAVRQVQCLINNYNNYPLILETSSGSFGGQTQAAVFYVQACAQIFSLPGTTIDGTVGAQTWNILYNEPGDCSL